MSIILSTVLGILGAGFPELLKIFSRKQDNAQEIKLLELQIQREKDGFQNKLEQVAIEAESEMRVAAYDFAKRRTTGVKWVDAFLELLSGTVRPLITYAFFGLYTFVKVAMYQAAVADLPWANAAMVIWSPDDMILLSIVVGFWFGSRGFSRAGKPS